MIAHRESTMPTTVNPIRVQEINTALVAHQKRADGEKLNSKEKHAVTQFRNVYKDIAEIEVNPSVRDALKTVLNDSSSSKVPDNILLTQHLKTLRAQGSASDVEIAQIKKFAAKLSEGEDDAISTTLAELALKGGISNQAVKDISDYLDQERSNRTSYVRSRKLLGAGIAAGTVIGGALAGPLVLWVPAVATAVASMAGSAVTAVSLGALAGGAVTGGAVGKLASANFKSAAKNYGVSD